MTTERQTMTADELLHLPDDGMRHELIHGELRTMPPAGGLHGVVANLLAFQITAFVRPRGLGIVLAAETGFWLERDPDHVRAPDVAFIAAGRLPEGGIPSTYLEIVPDLAAEVVSPNDTAREVEEKIHEWLQAGVRMVLALRPPRRTVTVYRSVQDVTILTEDDVLDGGDVLPGFTCPVRDLFPF